MSFQAVYTVHDSSDNAQFWINTFEFIRGKWQTYTKSIEKHFNFWHFYREKPYKCGQCGKDFRQKAILDQHTRTHQVVVNFLTPPRIWGFVLTVICELQDQILIISSTLGWSTVLLSNAELSSSICHRTGGQKTHWQPHEPTFDKVTEKQQ